MAFTLRFISCRLFFFGVVLKVTFLAGGFRGDAIPPGATFPLLNICTILSPAFLPAYSPVFVAADVNAFLACFLAADLTVFPNNFEPTHPLFLLHRCVVLYISLIQGQVSFYTLIVASFYFNNYTKRGTYGSPSLYRDVIGLSYA